MIPVQLRLKNFLSYRDARLEFRGLHVACVCGSNGAGKSSLLEAIAWAVWGQSRAPTEDDVIHMGEMEAKVDYTFICCQQTYRIIRTRYRGRAAALEFQVKANEGFRSLTSRGMRATQDLIQQHIRLDYDTFINSAYLRQGKADEFMLKRPSERKQILADLLKLDQYDELSEKAKEQSRHIKAEIAVLEQTIESVEHQLQNEPELVAQITTLEANQAALKQQQDHDRERLKQLHGCQQQRQLWLQDQALIQQQHHYLRQEGDRLHQEQASFRHQCQTVDAILTRADTITNDYARFQALQGEDERFSQQFQHHQRASQRLQTLQQQQSEAIAHLRDQIRTIDTQLDSLSQQDQEIEHILRKRDSVHEALTRFHQATAHLKTLDQLQTQAVPLLQRKQQLQQQIQQQQIRLSTQLDELQTSTCTLQQQQTRHPEIQKELGSLTSQLDYLEKRCHYQQQVRERGTERRSFMERLQERQRELERQLAEVDHKIHWLRDGHLSHGLEHENNANHSVDVNSVKSNDGTEEHIAPLQQHFPPCPLCDRPLDAQHWQVVLERHYDEHRDIRGQLWVIREQLSASEKEIQILRQEYRDLEHELAAYEEILQYQGRLQAQIQTAEQSRVQLQTLLHQKTRLEHSLQHEDYGVEFRDELRSIDQTLIQLQYDERNHALARGQVDQWRWSEIKAAEIQQAEKRRSRIQVQCAELESQRHRFQEELNEVSRSPRQQELDRLEQELRSTGYEADAHTHVRQNLRRLQSAPSQYQDLIQAQQQRPMLQERLKAIAHALHSTQQTLQTIETQLTELYETLATHPDCGDAIHDLETHIQQRRSHLDDIMTQLGRLQQQQQQFDALKVQQNDQQLQIQQLQYQHRIYQELTIAFGKNGIQALMIENILPQLETEANRILGRLSANQLHIQFVTQRASKSQSRASRKIAAKLIDTLDIRIADTQGTRSYETYSGGEAFRVNFAIRLALARLLAQRSGTALQLLIIDEGFGTQDQAGCDRLVSAINAIASDFACILTVTHMPHLKEAFQTRIEIEKGVNGSYLSLIN